MNDEFVTLSIPNYPETPSSLLVNSGSRRSGFSLSLLDLKRVTLEEETEDLLLCGIPPSPAVLPPFHLAPPSLVVQDFPSLDGSSSFRTLPQLSIAY